MYSTCPHQPGPFKPKESTEWARYLIPPKQSILLLPLCGLPDIQKLLKRVSALVRLQGGWGYFNAMPANMIRVFFRILPFQRRSNGQKTHLQIIGKGAEAPTLLPPEITSSGCPSVGVRGVTRGGEWAGGKRSPRRHLRDPNAPEKVDS
jgi:hypothetical protein